MHQPSEGASGTVNLAHVIMHLVLATEAIGAISMTSRGWTIECRWQMLLLDVTVELVLARKGLSSGASWREADKLPALRLWWPWLQDWRGYTVAGTHGANAESANVGAVSASRSKTLSTCSEARPAFQ